MNTDLDKARIISESDLPKEAKQVGVLGAIMGASSDSIIRGMVATVDTLETAKASKQPKRIRLPTDPTARQIAKMMTENTGVAMLDSGGAYGRAWQRNRENASWLDIPEKDVHVETWGDKGEWNLSITTNIFPYLKERLGLNEETDALNRQMRAFKRRKGNEDLWGLSLAEEFAESITGKKTEAFNTYNGDSTLSQVLQGVIIDYGESYFVALQIHGGCDVRGGYTEPYIFQVDEQGVDLLFDERNIYATCGCGNCSSDDCGYHWYWDGSTVKNPYQEDDELPKMWQPKELKDGSPLVCQKCNQEVRFA